MIQPNLLIVGSVALDTIRTPFGSGEKILGGTAVFASCAAGYFCRPAIVGVVGDDFPADYERFLLERSVDLTCLERVPGPTFHWKGYYEGDMNVAVTESTELGVFADFSPKIPDTHRSVPYVFLGNIHPQLQLDVLDRIEGEAIVAADTMNFWITGDTLDSLKEVVRRVTIMLVNDGEAHMLSGKSNLLDAAEYILGMGPKVVIIKKGSHGSTLFMGGGMFSLPAVPLRTAKDPTGAGDTFAGGMMGYLTGKDEFTAETLRQAIVIGTAMASFTVEDFSVKRLTAADRETIHRRVDQLREMTTFGEISF